MITLAYGLAVVLGAWWLFRWFAAANPAVLAKAIKGIGGGAVLVLAAVLLVRGLIDVSLALMLAGAWLLGWGGMIPARWRRRPVRSAGSVSRVRSAVIEMELDHDTGAMTGTVLAGRHALRGLDGLSDPELAELYDECRQGDPDGVRLLEAYLDRRSPGWREHAEGHPDPGVGAAVQAGAMTKEEAYQILGLQPGASPEEVRGAHRALMKKLHPDQGGTTYLAARINEAKDVLLRRHRRYST